MDDLIVKLIMYGVLVVSLSVHEWAHAWSAWRLGDPTAKMLGRVTLNPMAHIDMIGTVIIPLLMIFFSPGFAIIGWAKPVPINSRYFKNPNRDDLIVTGAGPLSNVIIFVIMGALSSFLLPMGGVVAIIVVYAIIINLLLAVFNMIPIPPLDGSHFLRVAIGMRYETFARLSMIGPIILIILINLPPFQQFLGGVIAGGLQIWPQIGNYIGG